MTDVPLAADPAEPRAALERMLIDADRTMMQTVQTALSMIGFGFTITTFFNEVAGRIGAAGGGQVARIVGAALLFIGLLLLVTGTVRQARYRRELQKRYAAGLGVAAWIGLRGRFTPAFVAALLLMLVGALSLASALLRWFF